MPNGLQIIHHRGGGLEPFYRLEVSQKKGNQQGIHQGYDSIIFYLIFHMLTNQRSVYLLPFHQIAATGNEESAPGNP